MDTGSGWGGFEDNVAAVIAEDALNDHQAHTMAAPFGGGEGLKELTHTVGRDTGSVIVEGDPDHMAVEAEGDREVSAAFHGLEGVTDDIIKGLLDLGGVGPGVGEAWWWGEDLEGDAAVCDFRFEWGEGGAECVGEGKGLAVGVTGSQGIEELGKDAVEACDFCLSDLEMGGEGGTGFGGGEGMDSAFEELEVDTEGVEGVTDFVCDACGEEDDGVEAFGFDEFAGGIAVTGDIAEEEDGAIFWGGGLCGVWGWEGCERGEIDFEETVLGAKHFDFAGSDGLWGGIVGEEGSPMDGGVEVCEGAFFFAGVFEAEEAAGGAVGEGDGVGGVEDDEAFAEGMEDRFEEAFFGSEAQELGLDVAGVEFCEAADKFIEEGVFHD